MKYGFTYSCGHEGEVDLFGKTSDREYRLSKLREDLCPECQAAETEKKLRKDIEDGMCELEGSEKQVAWAAQIRHIQCHKIEEMFAENSAMYQQRMATATGKDREEMEKQFNDTSTLIRRGIEDLRTMRNSAKWWIDNRHLGTLALLQTVVGEIKSKDDKQEMAADNTSSAVAAQAEAIVTPDKVEQDIVAEITATDEYVSVKSEKNEALRLLVKANGYSFNSASVDWRMKMSERNGTPADRAAEIGNACLNAGIPILIYDKEIRRKAIEADFVPRHTRWVGVRAEGSEYAGWLSISWDGRENDIYSAARKLKGSKWSSPSVVVPVAQYQQVLDFADLMNFKITSAAQSTIDEFTNNLAAPVSPSTPEKTDEPVLKDKLQAILDSSREVVPELMDNDED